MTEVKHSFGPHAETKYDDLPEKYASSWRVTRLVEYFPTSSSKASLKIHSLTQTHSDPYAKQTHRLSPQERVEMR